MDILVIDDSQFSQKITCSLIGKYIENAVIHTAADGEDGLEKYTAIRPDYLFTDLLMPKLNGDEVVKRVKIVDPAARIVIVTADVQQSTKQEMEALGILAFINKPFNDEKAKLICEVMRNFQNE